MTGPPLNITPTKAVNSGKTFDYLHEPIPGRCYFQVGKDDVTI